MRSWWWHWKSPPTILHHWWTLSLTNLVIYLGKCCYLMMYTSINQFNKNWKIVAQCSPRRNIQQRMMFHLGITWNGLNFFVEKRLIIIMLSQCVTFRFWIYWIFTIKLHFFCSQAWHMFRSIHFSLVCKGRSDLLLSFGVLLSRSTTLKLPGKI